MYTLLNLSPRGGVKAAIPSSDRCLSSVGAFASGNLYWLVSNGWKKFPYVCCFDLETECFSTFPVPLKFIADKVNPKGMLYTWGIVCVFVMTIHQMNLSTIIVGIYARSMDFDQL